MMSVDSIWEMPSRAARTAEIVERFVDENGDIETYRRKTVVSQRDKRRFKVLGKVAGCDDLIRCVELGETDRFRDCVFHTRDFYRTLRFVSTGLDREGGSTA